MYGTIEDNPAVCTMQGESTWYLHPSHDSLASPFFHIHIPHKVIAGHDAENGRTSTAGEHDYNIMDDDEGTSDGAGFVAANLSGFNDGDIVEMGSPFDRGWVWKIPRNSPSKG